MIHFLPESFEPASATPIDESIERLECIRTALSVAAQVGGIEAAAPATPEQWGVLSPARQRMIEARSIESAQAAAAGLEMLAAQRAAGTSANPQSIAHFADLLRAELHGLNRMFSL